MKILVCVDGSQQSLKAAEEAAIIAGGCNADEVSVIHVYEKSPHFPGRKASFAAEEYEMFKRFEERGKEEITNILTSTLELFDKNIKVSTIYKEGHPAETIARVAREGGYDLLVVGSRGLGGLKKLMLGSVSNALLQEAQSNVMVVKN